MKRRRMPKEENLELFLLLLIIILLPPSIKNWVSRDLPIPRYLLLPPSAHYNDNKTPTASSRPSRETTRRKCRLTHPPPSPPTTPHPRPPHPPFPLVTTSKSSPKSPFSSPHQHLGISGVRHFAAAWDADLASVFFFFLLKGLNNIHQYGVFKYTCVSHIKNG